MLKKFKIPDIYYPLILLAYFLTMFVPMLRVGLFGAAVMVVIVLSIGLEIFKSDGVNHYKTLMNISVFIYFIYNLFSFIWVLKNGFPISIYIGEFSNSVLPVVFYFAAVLTENKPADKERFYKFFICAFTVFSIVSIIFYLWAPQFYCDFLFNSSLISKADKQTVQVRMESFMGSTTLSFMGVASMIFSSHFILKDVKKPKFIYYILFVFSFVVVFLANGRAGMVAAILVILFLNWLVFFEHKLFEKKYLYIELGAIAAAIFVLSIAAPSAVMKVMARLVSLPGAIGQRSEQWIAAMNNMYGQWFGNGLGVNGHKALNIEGAHVVADGGLVKLFCEEGALGFSLFVFIVLRLLLNGFKDLKNNFAELMLISITLLMSIGSNIIAFQLCTPLFFYAAGIISLNTSQAVNDGVPLENTEDTENKAKNNIIKFDFKKRKNV